MSTTREQVIQLYPRMGKTAPFSQRLNDFIYKWFKLHEDYFVFVDEDDFDDQDIPGTFKKHCERFKETGKIHIWKGASDCTIFGHEKHNHMFRAWHDYIHITHGRGYDFMDETYVAEIQKTMLPDDWAFERELITIEIVGQALYFFKHGEFLNDQRTFTWNYLRSAMTINQSGQ